MKRKMALLEQAHGLLCNAPGHGGRTDPAEVEKWNKLRAKWIEQWFHVIEAHATKHRNRRVSIGNEAITEYEKSRNAAPPARINIASPTRPGLDIEEDP